MHFLSWRMSPQTFTIQTYKEIQTASIQGGEPKMTAKERIRAIRLSEKLQNRSAYGKKLGVSVNVTKTKSE